MIVMSRQPDSGQNCSGVVTGTTVHGLNPHSVVGLTKNSMAPWMYFGWAESGMNVVPMTIAVAARDGGTATRPVTPSAAATKAANTAEVVLRARFARLRILTMSAPPPKQLFDKLARREAQSEHLYTKNFLRVFLSVYVQQAVSLLLSNASEHLSVTVTDLLTSRSK
ncbi:hypothetical protein MHPYR_200047 [uncultured Mycobacterium sp.]|uniref:Uncharacterized protein n=1 Tax=uncultured Mycobacterium sp. TaxID=171292 RepID=A0A1Y5PGV8_9MYCO|nr:hypothetical protein MHPYR_200047 [uncultured Mycobacterium sp.]